MSKNLRLEAVCQTSISSYKASIAKRLIAQLRAKGLPNEQLLQECEFTHSEQDEAYDGLIWSSQGYFIKQVGSNELMIASTENDNLRVWQVTIPVLFGYGQFPEGFDLDKRTPLFEGQAAKLYLIDKFIY